MLFYTLPSSCAAITLSPMFEGSIMFVSGGCTGHLLNNSTQHLNIRAPFCIVLNTPTADVWGRKCRSTRCDRGTLICISPLPCLSWNKRNTARLRLPGFTVDSLSREWPTAIPGSRTFTLPGWFSLELLRNRYQYLKFLPYCQKCNRVLAGMQVYAPITSHDYLIYYTGKALLQHYNLFLYFLKMLLLIVYFDCTSPNQIWKKHALIEAWMSM